MRWFKKLGKLAVVLVVIDLIVHALAIFGAFSIFGGFALFGGI